jgi:HAD superfamily hydrolase (TIGR01509 family)
VAATRPPRHRQRPPRPPILSTFAGARAVSYVPRALIFDLDGVLADLCEMHRDLFIECFNANVVPAGGVAAPGGAPLMTVSLHAEKLEGMSTKLKLATCRALFPGASYDADAINARKQARTIEELATMTFPTRARAALLWARAAGLKVAVYTNSIRATLDIVLARLGLAELCDLTLSNEDVPAAKPSPSGYVLAFARLGLAAAECLIFEDSAHGLAAARGSGAAVIPVLNSMDVTPDFVRAAVEARAPPAPKKVRVVVPLAGPDAEAKAFVRTSRGAPMWHAVVENLLPADRALRAACEVHVIVAEALRARFDAEPLAAANLHSTRAVAGPLSTVLSLRALINDSTPLLVANADQFLEFDRGVDLFYRAAFHPSYEGAVST